MGYDRAWCTKRFVVSLVSAALLLATSLTGASAQNLTQFPIPTANSLPSFIALGSDENLWFTELGGNKIGRITTGGVITEFPTPAANSGPTGITAGLDGAIWFGEGSVNNIGRIATSGAISEFAIPTSNSIPLAIAPGPDGAMWFVEGNQDQIGRITLAGSSFSEFVSTLAAPADIAGGPDGRLWFTAINDTNHVGRADPTLVQQGTSNGVASFGIPTTNGGPAGITAGPDGALWFTETNNSKIGRIGTDGTVTNEFTLPTANSQPGPIAVGPDGALWFTEGNTNQIGRITTTGAITEFPLALNDTTGLGGIATGPDGALWFTEFNTNKIERFVPPPSGNTQFSAILPSSRSIEVGATATAFATLINTDTVTATACKLAPITTVPARFSFQTTNPATNGLTGSVNTPVNIAAGQSQTFVIAMTATASFSATDVEVGFSCANEAAASISSGLNTFLLSAASAPVPDVVALAATLNKDGIVDIPGSNATGIFAVATVNVGASGAITVSADTGGVTLPVTITLCETDPSTGACTSAVGPSVSTTINANSTPTFGIFVSGNGTVPFSPAVNRIFVRLKDQNGMTRGSTSVAARTQ